MVDTPPHTPARRGRRWRPLRLPAIVLGGAYLAYLLLGNLFLNTALGPWTINRKPDRFQLHWQAGLTAWPGQVVLWNPRIEGLAGTVPWSLQAERADGRIALLPLLDRELRFPSIQVEGVEAAFDRDGTGTGRPVAPAPARPGGWSLRFDRIASDDVRGARFGHWRLDGNGRAEFGLYKQLRGGPLEVTPSWLRFGDARLALDGEVVLEEAELDARLAIDRHARAQASGLRRLLMTEAELVLEGRTRALQVQRADGGRLTLRPVAASGRGRATGRIGWNRGALVPGSRLDFSAPVSMASRGGEALLELGLEVDRDIRLRALLPEQVDDTGDALAVDARFRVDGTAVPLDNFRALLPRTSGHLVGSWQFASLDWLGTFFADAPWLALEGAGRVDADLHLVDGEPGAGSRVEVPGVEVTADLMGNRVQGRARALGSLRGGADGEGVRPELELHLDRFSITDDHGRGARYVEGRDLDLQVQATAPLAPDLLAAAPSSSPSSPATAARGPSAALVRAGRALKARLRFDDASVPDLRAYNRYLPKTHLRFEGGSGRLSGDLSVDGAGAVGQGWLRVTGRDARLHAAGLALRGNVDIHTRLRRAGIEDGRFNIDGSRVRLDDISLVEPGGEVRRGWWARIDLSRARLDWDAAAGGSARGGADVDIDGRAGITMKDVGFLLALYSQRRDYPGWIGRLVDAGQARVTGDVRWRDDVLVFDNLVANNDRFDVNARLRLQGNTRRGNLYARWGVLSMAVDIDGARRDFHLLRARRWYDAQPSFIR